jgi:hypothetical protein
VNGHTGELRHCDTVAAGLAARRIHQRKCAVPQANSYPARGQRIIYGQNGLLPAAASILEGLPYIVVRRETPGV